MAGPSLHWKVSQSGPSFTDAFLGFAVPIANAAQGAIVWAADTVKTDGRAAIGAAGFSTRWQNALRVNVFPKTGASIDAAAYVFHKIPYADVFEAGAMIRGRPILWVPLPGTPKKLGSGQFSKRITPALYADKIGPLVLLPNTKRPILAAPVSGRRPPVGPQRQITPAALRRGAAGRGRVTMVPLFVGLDAVSIRKRFSISAIVDRASAGLATAYFRALDPGN